jgi:hypothetical protein
METKIFQARYQIDNMINICEQLLRGSGGGRNNAAPPMLALAEKNTELQDLKVKEQLQLHKDQQRAEREAAAASTMSDEARAALEADAARDEEEAEYAHDEDEDAGEEALVVPDPGDATISLDTRRKRLGTLLMHKRRQYTAATDVLHRGREQLRKSIEGERNFLHGVSHLAKYWTIRTIQNDPSAPVNPQAPPKGPPFNPYQNGLPAGATSAYPSMLIDYRIGARQTHARLGGVNEDDISVVPFLSGILYRCLFVALLSCVVSPRQWTSRWIVARPGCIEMMLVMSS